jgi:hypothetical protein
MYDNRLFVYHVGTHLCATVLQLVVDSEYMCASVFGSVRDTRTFKPFKHHFVCHTGTHLRWFDNICGCAF